MILVTSMGYPCKHKRTLVIPPSVSLFALAPFLLPFPFLPYYVMFCHAILFCDGLADMFCVPCAPLLGVTLYSYNIILKTHHKSYNTRRGPPSTQTSFLGYLSRQSRRGTSLADQGLEPGGSLRQHTQQTCSCTANADGAQCLAPDALSGPAPVTGLLPVAFAVPRVVG